MTIKGGEAPIAAVSGVAPGRDREPVRGRRVRSAGPSARSADRGHQDRQRPVRRSGRLLQFDAFARAVRGGAHPVTRCRVRRASVRHKLIDYAEFQRRSCDDRRRRGALHLNDGPFVVDAGRTSPSRERTATRDDASSAPGGRSRRWDGLRRLFSGVDSSLVLAAAVHALGAGATSPTRRLSATYRAGGTPRGHVAWRSHRRASRGGANARVRASRSFVDEPARALLLLQSASWSPGWAAWPPSTDAPRWSDGANLRRPRRPPAGMRAAAERGVRHPLSKPGIGKPRCGAWRGRSASLCAGRPRQACLASRIPYGGPHHVGEAHGRRPRPRTCCVSSAPPVPHAPPRRMARVEVESVTARRAPRAGGRGGDARASATARLHSGARSISTGAARRA